LGSSFARLFGPFKIITNPAAITRSIFSSQAGRKEPLVTSGSIGKTPKAVLLAVCSKRMINKLSLVAF
jgi:hypothetical protein